MLRKRSFWLVVILLLTAGGISGYVYYTTKVATAQVDEEETVQSAPVRVGDITVSATGAGTVIPTEQIEVSFLTSGRLEELLVRVGDEVQAGDVLATLDDKDAQQAVLNAELQLAQAVMRTDGATTAAGVSYNDIAIEQARLSLQEVQDALIELRSWEPDPDDIAQAQASLDAAQANFNAALGQEAASSTNISVQAINVDQAERDLTTAQEAYDTAWDQARDWELGDPRRATALENERENTANGLLRAQESLQVAQLNYQASVSNTNSSSSAGAESNLLGAQVALAQAQTGPTSEELAAAENTVRLAELAYQQALLNMEADELSLAQSELNLQTAQQSLDQTALLAPVSGTVMAINGSVGEQISSGAFLTLADLETPLLEIYLDETDLDKVGVDFDVDVIFDALPDEIFGGTVVQVDPQLTDSNGVTAVRALVVLDSFAKPQTLPVGLNATVDVIGGRTQGALLVPVEALREITPGQYAVFVMVDGQPELRFVEVGLMDYTYAEILSGVEQGQEVTTGIIETE